MKTPFPVLWPLLSFPDLLVYWLQHFHSIIFENLKQLNWNSITSTSLVMLSKAHLTSHSRMSGSRWMITPSWLSWSWRTVQKRSSWPRKSRWCDHSPRARHPGMRSQAGLRKHHYKVSGGDGIPVELFQILEDDAVKVLHSICQQIWKTQQWPQDWKRCFDSNSKKRQCQRMLKLLHNCTHLTC